MKLLAILCLGLLAACNSMTPASTSTSPPTELFQSTTVLFPSPAVELTNTSEIGRSFNPMPSATPWMLPAGLSLQEHPLARPPELDPLVLVPLDNLDQQQMLSQHAADLQESLPRESYYSLCACDLWAMQGKNRLATYMVESFTHTGRGLVGVTQNGKVIFSVLNESPGVTSDFRVLTTYDNHWVLELAGRLAPDVFPGRIFIDGKSIDALYGYDQSFGFQTIQGRPFYFYERNEKVGISYDGHQIPLGYDGVSHYGCCSGAELNPRIAQNMIAFFAWRGAQWYYVEVGVFNPSVSSGQ